VSDADENKLKDLSFDINASVSADDADDSFDFDFAAEEATILTEDVSGFDGISLAKSGDVVELDLPSSPSRVGIDLTKSGDVAEPEIPDEPIFGNIDLTKNGDTVEPEIPGMPGFGGIDLTKNDDVDEPVTPDIPSNFLTGETEEPTTEPDTAIPVVETPRKKGKKGRKEKTSAPREPMDLGAGLSLGFGVLALLGLVAINALIFTAPQTPGIGGSSTTYYAVGVNVFGLVFVAVPFLFWKFRRGAERAKGLQLFDVLLGVALMAFVLGVLCLLTTIYRYDFTFKP